MNVLYEEFRDGIEALDVRRNEKYVYPPHFHRNIEILISLEGSRSVVHNGVPYHVGNGDIFFCGSYDLHSYGADTEGKKNDCLVIVPAARTARFNERNRGLKPASPLIHDETLCARLLEIADRFMADKNQSESVRGAACELLLALIGERLDFVQGKERDETQLIRAILSYLSEHFREDVSLPVIARKFGYAQAHVSRVFHRYTNTGLPRYVNRLRLNYIETRRRNDPSANLTDLIFDAGFKSIPTYYRARSQDPPIVTR